MTFEEGQIGIGLLPLCLFLATMEEVTAVHGRVFCLAVIGFEPGAEFFFGCGVLGCGTLRALRPLMPAGWRQAGGSEDGGREIGEADRVIHAASSLHFSRLHQDHRLVQSAVVDVCFGAQAGCAVVGGDDDEGVIQHALVFENFRELAQRVVGMTHFVEVVRSTTASALGNR